MTSYRDRTPIPDLVRRAQSLAESLGFENSCTVEIGRLLRTLAAQVHRGRIGEIGTGCGVGSAWILSAIPPSSRLITVERDQERATAVRHLFLDIPNVAVIQGNWRAIRRHGPFALLFVDAHAAKWEEGDMVIDAMRVGGTVVMDDLAPGWPGEFEGHPDPLREFWLDHPRLAAAEVQVSPEMSAILATRLR